MQNKHINPIATSLRAVHAWCDAFDHQTTKREPHALVTVGNPPEASQHAGTPKLLDRLSVSAGATYRVRPGKHVVTVEFTEQLTGTERCQPRFNATRAVDLGIEQRQHGEVSRIIIVEAGKHYRLVGDRFMPCHRLM